ncbi:hypothetical protein DFQ26_001943 [Actinomortierella ambigua]|nr:hypothetical protein DFQ26_001943 [Actinomortierella ambigua]
MTTTLTVCNLPEFRAVHNVERFHLALIDLSRVVHVRSVLKPQDVASVIEDEVSEPFDLFDLTTPLWRIVVVRVEVDDSFFLLYTFHHAIGDGLSAMAMTEQLHEQINIMVSGPSWMNPIQWIVPSPKDKEMPLPIDLRVNCNPSFRRCHFEKSACTLFPWPLNRLLGARFWTGCENANTALNLTEITLLQLTQDETSGIMKAAKRRSITVQSMIHAAIAFATQACFIYPLQLRGDKVEALQFFQSPVSLRGLIPSKIDRYEQGNFVSELPYMVSIKPVTSFWSVAADYHKALTKATKTKPGIQVLCERLGLLRFLSLRGGAWENAMIQSLRKAYNGRFASTRVSNVGRGWFSSLTLEKQPYEVADAVFSQSACPPGSAFTIYITTAGGVMTITASCQRSTPNGRERN